MLQNSGTFFAVRFTVPLVVTATGVSSHLHFCMRDEQLIFGQIEISLNWHWAGGGRRRKKNRVKRSGLPKTLLTKKLALYLWGQGWCSGESTRLPFVARVQIPASTPYVSVEFVVGSLPCSERFFSGYSGFPLSSETSISKFQFDQESSRRRTT